MRAALLLLLALALPVPARADTEVFEMRLAGSTLGTLTFEASEAGSGWTTDLDNTPLGVADGLFAATSVPVRTASGEAARRYRGETATSRRSRVVEVLHAEGRVLSVSVTPDDEATEMSDAARVPPGVIDPVEAFERLLHADGCPAAFSIYDGRRVVAITPQASQEAGGRLTCDLSYEVALGPGHLSPLGIASLGVTLTYDRAPGAPQTLQEMDVRTGPLRLRILR